jgi:hypothetical protein
MSSFDEDMKQMRKQVTQEVIFQVNKDPQLYKDFVKARASSEDKEMQVDAVIDVVFKYTDEHDDWFGTVFIPELDNVDWKKVIKGV